MSRRVRVVPSYLLQGAPIDGEHVDEGSEGITVQKDDGQVIFLPWTSVGFVVRDPKAQGEEPF